MATGAVLIKTKIASFVVNQEPFTPHNLLMGVKTKWELLLFQVAPFVSFQGLQMGIQSNLDYPDSLGLDEIVRIIEGPDNRKYEY